MLFRSSVRSADLGTKVRKVCCCEANTVQEEAPATTDRRERLKTETDDLLDEIDEVLENNAEDFVRDYVQKGGE
jgi:ubiquitin-like protein Pup